MRHPIFNASTKRVGGIRFFKLGRINLSFSVSRKSEWRAVCTFDRRVKRTTRPVGLDLEAEIAPIVAYDLSARRDHV